MYIIIAGGGTLGTELIEKLALTKHDIVLIDSDKNVCDSIFAEYGIEAVHGAITRLATLKSAGISKADVLISTIRKDDVNLALSSLAKSCGVPEIIVLMHRKGYIEAYRNSGATRILGYVDTLVSEILYQIEKSPIKRVTMLGKGAVEIFIVTIPEKGKLAGRTVSDIASSPKLPQESIIAGVYNEETEEFKIARGNTKIEGGASLFVLTKPELVKETARYLIKGK
ncbi:MAG: TrkA family potassium uptake protein [Elusimicrobia bacterium]|jgi:trk system potassium uptake protein TrkA|nr:TrkA family potassium uptake protein [Elusimicrobiota bacterium]